MSFLKNIFIKDPQVDFSKGRKAFDLGDYAKASRLFHKSHKKFNDTEMKVISIENAAISAEYAENYEFSQELYFQTISTKLHTNQNPMRLLPDIDKTIQIGKLCEKPPIAINKLRLIKFLIFLSQKQFDKMIAFYQKLKDDSSDKYIKIIEKIWNLVHLESTFEENEKLPQINLPEGFKGILEDAEYVMRRCSLCNAVLNIQDQEEKIRKGNEFNLEAIITSYAPISIKKINLKTGTRGRISNTTIPILPLNLTTGENYSIIFSLIPNLPGEWIIGPLTLEYSIASEQGDYPASSKTIDVDIEDAKPALKISMESETIEEDMEYILTIFAENIGKTTLQGVKILLIIPDGVTIKEGTEEKHISTLIEGEVLKYDIRIQFSLNQSHFEGHIIRGNAYIDDGHRISKCSIKLGGN